MRSKNRIPIFFAFLFLLFWNPLSFYFIYRHNAVYDLTLIHFLFWSAFVAGCITLVLTIKNKTGKKIANSLLMIQITGILFSMIVLADGVVGLIRPEKNKLQAGKGLLFEPGSKLYFQTAEFDHMAEINSIGLRDKEIRKEKDDRFRIICVGDSWTYGWGVDVKNSWPRKLESFLHNSGIKNIEVINCGQPGRYSKTYRSNLEKLLPALKPDLVLLGMVQLDDLAQIHEERFPPPGRMIKKNSTWDKFSYAVITFLSGSVKNILRLTKKTEPRIISLKNSWKNSVADMVENFTPEQQRLYDGLNDSVKVMLSKGELTPGFLYYLVNHPSRAVIFNDPRHTATRFALAEMTRDIGAIKYLCNINNTRLIFLNLPVHYFTGHKVISGLSDSSATRLKKFNSIDSLYGAVASKNSVPYFEMTDAFSKLEDKSAYFFRYDGHPNAKGYETIARLAAQFLIDSNYFDRVNRQ
jgi:lysophospholipase L1-like esterase